MGLFIVICIAGMVSGAISAAGLIVFIDNKISGFQIVVLILLWAIFYAQTSGLMINN